MKKTLVALSIAITAIAFPVLAEERATMAEAKAMALKAGAHVQEHGREAAAHAFMTPNGDWHDRDLYVFMIDADGIALAHGARPDTVGRDRTGLQDYSGQYIVMEMLAVESEGWVDYLFQNPTNQQVEAKSSYIVRMDGGGFVGVGAYQE